MNTHDIELPMLPIQLFGCSEIAHQWGTLAVELDRRSRDSLIQKLQSQRDALERRVAELENEADRQRRGEPVAWLYEDELPDNYPYEVMFPYSKVEGVRMFPVYAPQPAEPSRGEAVGEAGTMPGTSGFTMACFPADKVPVGTSLYLTPQPAEPVELDKYDAGLLGGQDGTPAYVWHDIIRAELDRAYDFYVDQLDRASPQPAEPESCFCDRMYPDSNPDASCGDCPTRDYGVKPAEPVAWPADILLAAEMALEDAEDGESPTIEIHASRIVESLSAPQPAAPVKVPSDAEIIALALSSGIRKSEEHWGDRYYTEVGSSLIVFARALLARYGQPAEPVKVPKG